MKTISVKKVITRKPHHCWGCTALFPKGANLEICVSVDGGQIMSAYWCDTCVAFMHTLDLWDLQDGFDYGDLLNYPEYKPFIQELNGSAKS